MPLNNCNHHQSSKEWNEQIPEGGCGFGASPAPAESQSLGQFVPEQGGGGDLERVSWLGQLCSGFFLVNYFLFSKMLINRGMAQYDGYILSILSLGVLILCANLQITSDMLITFLCNLGGSLCIMHCFVLSSGWKSFSTSSQRTPRGELWFIARRGGTGRLWWWCWSGWSWQDGPMTSPYLAFISCSFCFWLNFLWSDLISNYYWQHRLANVLRKKTWKNNIDCWTVSPKQIWWY